uniref:Peptidase A2 domain-containing protein n=1 Tax=Bracon brevicornis TaxID=1563983 RepID=A0A6V7INR5_9HYME
MFKIRDSEILRAFYVNITIQGVQVEPFVDSGSNKSFAAATTETALVKVGIYPKSVPPRSVVTAGCKIETSSSGFDCQVYRHGRRTRLRPFILRNLSEQFILGMDFLVTARIVIDFFDRTWHYRESPEDKIPFTLVDAINNIRPCGLCTLEEDQKIRLENFLQENLPPPEEKLGTTSKTSHRIDISNHPIRQRPHHTTPAIREIMWTEVEEMLENSIIVPSQSE